jgi:hypothetical protein
MFMDRAFIVGIENYVFKTLKGCINDANSVANFLVDHLAFRSADIRLLTDSRATRDAILLHLKWLTSGLRANDRIVFYYSGHGAQIASRNDEGEVDSMDEAICPFDSINEYGGIDINNVILDNDFEDLFKNIPQDVKFCWISDSCSSGSLHEVTGAMTKGIDLPADLKWRCRVAKDLDLDLKTYGYGLTENSSNFVLLAACKEAEFASMIQADGKDYGAFTYFLLQELTKKGGLSAPLVDVMSAVTTDLRSKFYSQTPQLAGSQPLFNLPFLG